MRGQDLQGVLLATCRSQTSLSKAKYAVHIEISCPFLHPRPVRCKLLLHSTPPSPHHQFRKTTRLTPPSAPIPDSPSPSHLQNGCATPRASAPPPSAPAPCGCSSPPRWSSARPPRRRAPPRATAAQRRWTERSPSRSLQKEARLERDEITPA